MCILFTVSVIETDGKTKRIVDPFSFVHIIYIYIYTNHEILARKVYVRCLLYIYNIQYFDLLM